MLSSRRRSPFCLILERKLYLSPHIKDGNLSVINSLPILEFLSQRQSVQAPLIDVRAPREFRKGHIPTAINLPLFSDSERATVGTAYKQVGRESAVLLGLDIVGPKMGALARQVQQFGTDQPLFVHCWRGGMRSESMARLWHTVGYEVWLLQGGYKAFRQYVHQQLALPWDLRVISGKTGSGKTDILHQLAARGEQIIDLEALACHKGSVFGGLGQPEQPQVEQFENDLFTQLAQMDLHRPIWIEDESNAIGRVFIPHPFWERIQCAPIYRIEIPLQSRVARLLREYADFPPESLALALQKIRKRLGGQHVKRAEEALAQQDFATAAQIALYYYDKAYSHSITERTAQIHYSLTLLEDQPAQAAAMLMQYALTQTHSS